MKVLLLTDNLGGGGKQRRLVELVKGFQKYGDIELYMVIFSDIVHFTEIYDLNVNVTIIKRIPKRNPFVFYRLLKLCRKINPDLIHSWGTMSTIFAIPSSVLLKIKLINGNIVDAPDDLHFFDKRLFRARLTFPFSTVIAGNSIAGLNAYGVPEHKRVCIYNGFDTKRISNLENELVIRKKLGINTDKVVGMVGSFLGNKDYDTYVKVAFMIFEKRNDVTFVAVGDGPELIKYKNLIPKKYHSRFIFTGLQRDVESIINVFNVGVLSTYTEGVSNAILEYMALSKPTVVTIGGGTVETIENDKTGFLIPPKNPDVMVEKILYLLDNTYEAKCMGLYGRKRLEGTFSLKKMTEAFYQLYSNLLIE